MSGFEIPESWGICTITDSMQFLGRGKSPKYSPKETGYYSVNQRCVYWEQIKDENRKHVEGVWFKKQNPDALVRSGDILLNSTGTGTLGRANLWNSHCGKYIADSHICILRTKQEVESKYILYLIRSHIGQSIIDAATTGSTNQIELSKSKLGGAEIPIPPLGEQRRIVTKIESTFKRIEAIEKAVESADICRKLRAAVLSSAFSGRLVPQDPSEGTGHQLLEQILAAKANSDSNASTSPKAKKRKTSK